MAKLVGAQWITERLDSPSIAVIDPRRPMKYLLGHLPGAINIPVYQAFGADGRLLSPDALAAHIGGRGLADTAPAVLYDSPEGQNATMLAWILEYLGHSDVYLMDTLFEAWKAEGREVRYKPVETTPQHSVPRVDSSIRATLEDVRGTRGLRLVDFRSREEFTGERSIGNDPPGHIPGAVNLVWHEIGGLSGRLLKPVEQLEALLREANVTRADKIVAYCRSGPRAALGYFALRELGFDVRLFDGSYAAWVQAGLATEK